MSKRFATAADLQAAPLLAVRLSKSDHPSDPISWGAKPEFYLESDLRKVAVRKQLRTDEFEKQLTAIWWKTGRPVPFVFRTADSTLRSLDAGCVGFLLNRYPPDADPITDEEGYVIAIRPRNAMELRYEPIRQRLLAAIEPR